LGKDDADSRRHFVRARDTRVVCRAIPKRNRLVGRHRLQPVVNAYNNRQSVYRNNLCMQAITVNDVFKGVTGIYDSLKRTHPEINLPNDGCANS
jgi:hypothetical protein